MLQENTARSIISRRARPPEEKIKAIDDDTADSIKAAIKQAGGYLMLPKNTIAFWMPLLNEAELRVLIWALNQTLGWQVVTSKDRHHSDRAFSIAGICKACKLRDSGRTRARKDEKEENPGLHRNSVTAALRVLAALGLVTLESAGGGKWYFIRIDLKQILAENCSNSQEEYLLKISAIRKGKSLKIQAGNSGKLLKNAATPKLSNKVLKIRKKETTTTAQTEVALRPPETPSRAVVAASLFDERLTAARQEFNRIEEQLGQAISGKTRADLQRTIEEQGFSIAQLAYAFAVYGRTYKTVGGLISFARSLREHAAAIEEWPCLLCYGNGIVAAPGSPFCDEALPCTCEEGKKRAITRDFEGLAEYLKDAANYCHDCRNTGKRRSAFDSDYEFCHQCEKGRGLHRETLQEREAAQRERQALIDAGKCPDCEGEGAIAFNGKALPCMICRGTGLSIQPTGSCAQCWGQHIDLLGKPCAHCARVKAIA